MNKLLEGLLAYTTAAKRVRDEIADSTSYADTIKQWMAWREANAVYLQAHERYTGVLLAYEEIKTKL